MAEKENKIGALWSKEGKSGGHYLTGTINGMKVIIFKNGYKKEDKHPDYIVYEQKDKKENTEENGMTTVVDDPNLPF